jgi:hypothetical protein
VNLVRSLLADGHTADVVDVREPVTAIRLGATWCSTALKMSTGG